MQNMWISVALIVAVIIVGIIAGKRLSTPGPQRRAVYFAFGTLAVLALWFFIFVAFFPAEWIVPFFTVACIIIPICVYMMVLRSGGKERASSSSLPTSYSSTTAANPLLICARLKTTRAMLLQLLRQARQQPNLLRLHSLLHLPLTQMAFLTRMLYSSTSSLARH